MKYSRDRVILLVEDEPLVAMAQQETLQRYGYRVVWASTGERAVEIAAERPEIDLVLMDINLGPGMDGTDAAQQILKTKELPVVFLLSYTDPKVVEKTEEIVSYGYIVKSSGDAVLLASLKTAFRLFDSRNRALETLAGEKERLRVTLHSVGDAVVATDAEGRVTFLNPVAEELTGHAADAAAGRPLADIFHIVHAYTRQRMENPVGRVIEEGRVVGLANHTVLISAGGEEYQIADSAAPIRDSTGRIIGVVLVFRDVTEEYAVRRQLQEREHDMRRAQRLANLGSWRFNISSGTVSASPQAYRVYGMDEREFTIEQVQSYPLPGYRRMLDAALRDLIERGTPYDVEFEIRRPNDGEIRVIHSVAQYDAEQNAVFGTLHDVTERKRTERQLREERERFATITELSPIGITTVDANGVITYANVAAERILGLHRDTITSRTYDAPEWEHTAPDGGPFPDEDQPFTIVRATLKPAYDVRHGITWPDGRHIELSINAAPILGDERTFRGMVTTVEDITERKRTEEEVRRLLREKEVLLRESHHRVGNNMNTLRSLLSLQSQATDSPQVRDALAAASDRIQAVARLYDRLFRNTPTGPLSIREFLVPLIDEIVEILSPLVRVGVSTDLEDVPLDPGTLSTIGIAVNELVTNSVKHAFPGKGDGRISVASVRRGSRIVLTYRDDGPGLGGGAAEIAAGGFGMQLVQMMIENLGGEMRVHPGPELRIDLELPNT